jgi:hypothetical protein
MATVHRKVQRVLWLAIFESVTQVRREYRRVFNEEPPHENSIRRWDRHLKETGSLVDKQRSGRSSASDELVENSFFHSPKKSVRKCARELYRTFKSNCSQSSEKRLRFTFSKMVFLRTMPFLMRHFHGAGLGGADVSNGPHDLRT